MFRINLF